MKNEARGLETWIAGILIMALLVVGILDLRARAMEGKHAHATGALEAHMPLLAPYSGGRVAETEIVEGAHSLVKLDGVGPLESDGKHLFRHGYGPESVFNINSERPRARLRLRFLNNVPHQELHIMFNGAAVETMTNAPGNWITREYALELRPNEPNRFVVTYARYNHFGAEIAPNDRRPIAGTFFDLDLYFGW